MIPVLYDQYEENFITNGIGLLVDAISCNVEESRNGKFELTLEYPQDGRFYSDLVVGAYVKQKPNDRDDPQPFRIYKVGKPVAGICTYYGEHISYELNSDPVPNFTASGLNPQQAIDKAIAEGAIAKPYTAWSDITTRKNMDIHGVYNVRNILGGVEGSIIDTYGGELQFDKYRIKLHSSRGQDNGVTIRYGKNLIDANMEKSISNVATAVFPYAWYTPESEDGEETEEELITLTEKIVLTPNADSYAHTYCIPVDFSDKFEDGVRPTEAALRTLAANYAASGIDLPTVSFKLSFIDLSRTNDYENLWAMEHVGLCDTVTVILERLGISETAKVVRTNYDGIRERYIEVEVGEARTNLYSELNVSQRDTFQKVIKTATRSEQLKQQFEKRILAVTAAITGNSGGYVVLSPAENPQEILIMDTPDTETAVNVWRWNLAGLGHSSSGVNGPFTTAITAAGEIVADFITAGELDGAVIKAGTVQAEALDVQYKQSVTTYVDDGIASLHDEMETRFEVTSEQISAKVSKTTMDSAISDSEADLKKYADDADEQISLTLSTQIQATAGELSAEVTRAKNAEAEASAAIKVNADSIKTKVSKGAVSSQISQESDKVTISSNRLVVNSDNFQLTADGHLTTNAATINGKFESSNYGAWGKAWLTIDDSVIEGGCSTSSADGAIDFSANYSGGRAVTINSNGNYGLRLQHQGNDRIMIDANITYGGNIFLNGYTVYETSDRNLKTNISENECDYVPALRAIDPVSYDWIDGSGHVSAGLIAQDVQDYIPEAVTMTEKGTLSISMTKLIPYIWSILRAMDKRIIKIEKG